MITKYLNLKAVLIMSYKALILCATSLPTDSSMDSFNLDALELSLPNALGVEDLTENTGITELELGLKSLRELNSDISTILNLMAEHLHKYSYSHGYNNSEDIYNHLKVNLKQFIAYRKFLSKKEMEVKNTGKFIDESKETTVSLKDIVIYLMYLPIFNPISNTEGDIKDSCPGGDGLDPIIQNPNPNDRYNDSKRLAAEKARFLQMQKELDQRKLELLKELHKESEHPSRKEKRGKLLEEEALELKAAAEESKKEVEEQKIGMEEGIEKAYRRGDRPFFSVRSMYRNRFNRYEKNIREKQKEARGIKK